MLHISSWLVSKTRWFVLRRLLEVLSDERNLQDLLLDLHFFLHGHHYIDHSLLSADKNTRKKKGKKGQTVYLPSLRPYLHLNVYSVVQLFSNCVLLRRLLQLYLGFPDLARILIEYFYDPDCSLFYRQLHIIKVLTTHTGKKKRSDLSYCSWSLFVNSNTKPHFRNVWGSTRSSIKLHGKPVVVGENFTDDGSCISYVRLFADCDSFFG